VDLRSWLGEFQNVSNQKSKFSELISNNIEKPGMKMASEFRGEFLASHVTGLGLDLAAITLKQGRDHGLPSYVTIRRQCGFGRVNRFFGESIPFFSDLHIQ
jgi:hypothetical protein